MNIAWADCAHFLSRLHSLQSNAHASSMKPTDPLAKNLHASAATNRQVSCASMSRPASLSSCHLLGSWRSAIRLDPGMPAMSDKAVLAESGNVAVTVGVSQPEETALDLNPDTPLVTYRQASRQCLHARRQSANQQAALEVHWTETRVKIPSSRSSEPQPQLHRLQSSLPLLF